MYSDRNLIKTPEDKNIYYYNIRKNNLAKFFRQIIDTKFPENL